MEMCWPPFQSAQARHPLYSPPLGSTACRLRMGVMLLFPQATSPTLVEDVRLTVPSDFTMDASPQSATIRAGQSATFDITITPAGDLTSTVGFSCTGLPGGSSCTFSPAILTPGINPDGTILTLTTTSSSAALPLMRQPGPLIYLCALAGSFGLFLFALGRGRNQVRQGVLIGTALMFALLLGSCSGGGTGGGGTGGGSKGTPTGTSTITVTATSATTHTTVLSITVTP